MLGTMTDMNAVDDASVDAVFSSHNIEHLARMRFQLRWLSFIVCQPDGFVL